MGKIKTRLYYWLRWSEKYAKTDMVYLAKGGFWLSGGFAVSFISSLLIALAFANFFPKDSYGTYKYAMSIIGLIGALYLSSGLATIVTQSASRGFEGTLKVAIKTSFKWSIFPVLASLGFSVYYFLNQNYLLGFSLLIPTILLPITNSFGLYGPFLMGKKEFATSTKYNVITTIITSGTLICAAIFTKSPISVIATYFLTTTILSSFFYLLTIKKYPPNNAVEKGAITYGKHLTLMGVLGTVVGNIDNILVFHFAGAISLATYAFAFAPIGQAVGLFKSTNPLLTPKIASKKVADLKKVLPAQAIRITLLMIIPTIAYVLLIPYFYRILFPKYVDSIIYSQLLALTFLAFAKKPLSIAIVAHGSKKVNYFLSVVNPTIYLILKLILLPIWGVMGAVVAEIINSFVALGLNFYIVKKLKD